MTLEVKDYLTGETLLSYAIIRFSMVDTTMCCTSGGGFLPVVPQKALLYKVLLTDTATSTVIEKTVLFSGYHFLMDKDGENQATITDNSLIFQILE